MKDEHVLRNTGSVGLIERLTCVAKYEQCWLGEWDGPSWMERAEEYVILVEKRMEMDGTNLG
jgi:hypothetical protein